MKARVTVTLKSGVLDPQGKAIEGALASLGIRGIASVRQGKLFELDLADADRSDLERALAEACERLLANTVIEDYRIEIDEAAGAAAQPSREAGTAPLAPADAAEVAARDTDIPAEGHP